VLAEQVEIVHRLWDRAEDEVTSQGSTTGSRHVGRCRTRSRSRIRR
jgi:hypothetical protein